MELPSIAIFSLLFPTSKILGADTAIRQREERGQIERELRQFRVGGNRGVDPNLDIRKKFDVKLSGLLF